MAGASAFYQGVREQLEARQTLQTDALAQLGTQQRAAILASRQQAGTPAARISTGKAEKTEAAAGTPLAVKLGLAVN